MKKVEVKIERIKVKSSLFKSNYIYRVYKNVFNHGIGSLKLFEGTYKECIDFLSQK